MTKGELSKLRKVKAQYTSAVVLMVCFMGPSSIGKLFGPLAEFVVALLYVVYITKATWHLSLALGVGKPMAAFNAIFSLCPLFGLIDALYLMRRYSQMTNAKDRPAYSWLGLTL